jgi:methionyl-tRNA formyltransferase
MYLNDTGMIGADTSRTIYYIEALKKNNLLPSYVLILLNTSTNLLPGQKANDNKAQLIKLLEEDNIQYEISTNNDINSLEVINIVKSRNETVFIYSGFGGALLRDDILGTGKKFLHVHGGYLPDYKGSTTNYYSLINENTIGASSIFLTKDIDCGPVLCRKKVSPPLLRVDIDHVHDSKVRAKVLVETLQLYISNGKFIYDLEKNEGGETYYIIHPVLKHIAILKE